MELQKTNHVSTSKCEKQEVSCPVCDSKSYSSKYKPTVKITDPIALYGAASSIPGTQDIVTCKTCTMVYENPRYPESVILSGYQSSDEAGHDSQYEMRVGSFLRALNRLKHEIPKAGARVLDIGSAGGAFLEAAKRYGYQIEGLEPSQYLVEQGQKRGLNLHQGTIDRHPLEKGSYDMVCFWDVIEHVVDPKKALEVARGLLKPGGVLLLNYPDIGTFQAKMAGPKFWWLISGHLHYFSRNTIGKLCALTGFQTYHYRRYFQTLQFGYLEQMAMHFKIPLSGLLKRLTPQFIQRIPIPYYASQTTVLAKIRPQ